MTSTARRRWSRDFRGEIDGILLGSTGPAFIHGYDPPAGGKWIDNVIPGKLGAMDRSNGELLWVSPCEVGYGRGFGIGLGPEDDVVILGPGMQGHRIARQSVATGELLGAREIEPFDQAVVGPEMSVTVTAGKVTGIYTGPMIDVWTHMRDAERYHFAAAADARTLVVFTNTNTRKQGVLALDTESGELAGSTVDPTFSVIHEFCVDGQHAMALVGDRAPGARRRGGSERLEVICYGGVTKGEGYEIWRKELANDSIDELPDVSIALNSGKLYVVRGALLEVFDVQSGRELGELTLPGLDERIAWCISDGAGLLAEETRASVFELPV